MHLITCLLGFLASGLYWNNLSSFGNLGQCMTAKTQSPACVIWLSSIVTVLILPAWKGPRTLARVTELILQQKVEEGIGLLNKGIKKSLTCYLIYFKLKICKVCALLALSLSSSLHFLPCLFLSLQIASSLLSHCSPGEWHCLHLDLMCLFLDIYVGLWYFEREISHGALQLL